MSERKIAGIAAVLFDFGRVLSTDQPQADWQRMVRLSGIGEERLHAGYWGHRDAYDRGLLTGVTYWQTVGSEAGVEFTAERIAELIAADVESWAHPNEPMVEWAGRLARAGVKTGVLSNIGDAMEAGLRAQHAWIQAFAHCTWSHRYGMAKPDAALYGISVEGLGCAAGEVLFIDDREKNVEGAERAGLLAILYTTHVEFEVEMRRRGYGELLDIGTV